MTARATTSTTRPSCDGTFSEETLCEATVQQATVQQATVHQATVHQATVHDGTAVAAAVCDENDRAAGTGRGLWRQVSWVKEVGWSKNFWRFAAVLVAAVGSVALTAPTASADLADDTGRYGVDGVDTRFGAKPHASVAAMETIGNTIYVGGKFTSVTRDERFYTNQSYLAAFDATTGAYLPGFAPALNGPVNALEVYDGKLLIGGQFTTVNGVNRPAIALLNPQTGARESFPFKVHGGAPANVRGFDLSGDYLYVTGTFNRAVADGVTVSIKNAARFHIPSESVDRNWLPNVTGASWAIAADPDNGRVYVASFQSGGLISLDASNGRTVRTGFGGGSINKPYDVVVHRGKIWIAGAEHALFAIDAQSLNMVRYHYAGRAFQANPWNGGEYQAIEAVGDRIYAACHCNYENYLVGENVRRPISFLVAFDADSGLHIPSFDPHLLGDSGPWAITEGPDGCIWTGGELRKSGASRIKNLAKICDITNFGNGAVTNLRPGAATSRGSGWFEVDLGSSQAIRSVEVHANIGDNFIIISDRPFPNNRSGAQLAGAEGFHGTRVITSDGRNERWFSTHARYVRIYTSTSLSASQIQIYGRSVVADDERPGTARKLVAAANGSTVDLAWQSATDNVGVVGYRIYRQDNGAGPFVQQGTSTSTSFADTGLPTGSYRYYLRAFDAAGNVGWRNQIVEVTVGAGPVDTERPSTPKGLNASAVSATSATLTWVASTDNVGVVEYSVYADGVVIASSATAQATLTGLTPATSYEFWVRAVDAAGNISWRTNVVTVQTS